MEYNEYGIFTEELGYCSGMLGVNELKLAVFTENVLCVVLALYAYRLIVWCISRGVFKVLKKVFSIEKVLSCVKEILGILSIITVRCAEFSLFFIILYLLYLKVMIDIGEYSLALLGCHVECCNDVYWGIAENVLPMRQKVGLAVGLNSIRVASNAGLSAFRNGELVGGRFELDGRVAGYGYFENILYGYQEKFENLLEGNLENFRFEKYYSGLFQEGLDLKKIFIALKCQSKLNNLNVDEVKWLHQKFEDKLSGYHDVLQSVDSWPLVRGLHNKYVIAARYDYDGSNDGLAMFLFSTKNKGGVFFGTKKLSEQLVNGKAGSQNLSTLGEVFREYNGEEEGIKLLGTVKVDCDATDDVERYLKMNNIDLKEHLLDRNGLLRIHKSSKLEERMLKLDALPPQEEIAKDLSEFSESVLEVTNIIK